MPFMTPADDKRKIELMRELLLAVVFEKDNPNYPLHADRTVKHIVARWANWGTFTVLDEICGADGLRDAFFPEIPSITMMGEQFGSNDVLHLIIDWIGTDGAQITITYHREAHIRMVAERTETLRVAAVKRSEECPPIESVLAEYEKLGRQSWTPTFEAADATDAISSRYFGLPWMPHNEEWPVNDYGVKLGFVMQINIADLPGEIRERLGGKGLVAMFYDVDADWNPHYEGPEDHETAAVFRRYDTSIDGGIRLGRKLEGNPQRIASWRAAPDYPDFADFSAGAEMDVTVQKFIVDYDFHPSDGHYRRRGEPASDDAVMSFMKSAEKIWGADACDAETAATATDRYCASGDKLAGWPAWDGGRRWPENEGRRMALFYQFDLMDPVWTGFSFWRGDERGHLFFDEQDLNVFRLTWDRGNEY